MTATLGLLVSGRGSNMRAVLAACATGRLPAEPALVISNNLDAPALTTASEFDVATMHLSRTTHPEPEQLDAAICANLHKYAVDWVVLAGYMKKIGPQTLAAYRNRMINIHPSLLPRHGGPGMFGMHVHEAVIAAGDRESGATVHLVTDAYDQGAILRQARVPVLENDTPATLAARVLVAEHTLLVETLADLVTGQLKLPDANG
ncbi:MAG: phosphoribosylglycinamide formyltransferase [Gammaproteobacteria bacterium]